jgi:hypothetical protein
MLVTHLRSLFMRFPRILSVLLGLTLLPTLAHAQAAPDAPATKTNDATASTKINDPDDLRHVKEQVAALLLQGNYDEIDRLAQRVRSEKTRMPGGGWQLTSLYSGLMAPKGSDPEPQIARLKAWIAARPNSITAHVALAKLLIEYAWVARGNGQADTVTDRGWKLFAARSAEAKRVLDDSAHLTPMCPEWFSEMQTVALAQDWDKARTADLFHRAIQFEPDFDNFYTFYANYLLPKWDGDPGEATTFAKQSADSIGGSKGNYIYYRVSVKIITGCNCKPILKKLDWTRIQQGRQAQIEMFGNSNADINQFAQLAVRYQDRETARTAFDQIGDKWSVGVWKTRESFDNARNWANSTAPSVRKSQDGGDAVQN